MIEITDHTGRKHFVMASTISDIREIAESAASGGIRSHVRLVDGRVIQSRDDATALASAVSMRRDGRH
jgi:hypothetical protein